MMNSPDADLDSEIEKLGEVNVPSLVNFLIATHPTECPYELAISALKSLEGSGYKMGFQEQEVCANCGDTSCASNPKSRLCSLAA